MTSPYVGQIMMFAGNFAPVGWAKCDGTTMAIQQYTALYSLLGTFYGGNGQTTFNLPDLRSRVPIHQGQGLGLSVYVIGQLGGFENITLTNGTMPLHTHALNATATASTGAQVGSTVLPGQAVGSNTPEFLYVTNGAAGTLRNWPLAAGCVSNVGSSLPHTNMMPTQCLTFCIALIGVFPSQ